MTATTSVETIAPTATRAEKTPGQLVWDEAEPSYRGRLADARTKLGEDAAMTAVVDLALADQERFLDSFADEDLDELNTNTITAERIALLMLRTPATARVIRILDEGYIDDKELTRQQRYDLKEVAAMFNQDLAAALMYMPKSMLPRFSQDFLARSYKMVAATDAESLTGYRFERAMAGMSREVAVGRAINKKKPDDWRIRPATAKEDVRGWDIMVSRGPLEVRIDVKNDDGFLRKLDTIKQDDERQLADDRGWFKVDGVYIINADALGKIRELEYAKRKADQTDDPEAPVIELIEVLLEDQRLENLRKVSRNVISRTA